MHYASKGLANCKVGKLEERLEACGDKREAETLTQIVQSANALMESVKHSIVILQLAKGELMTGPGLRTRSDSEDAAFATPPAAAPEPEVTGPTSPVQAIPPTSYSSSEDEDEFFDVDEALEGFEAAPALPTAAVPVDAAAASAVVGQGEWGPEPEWGDEGTDFDAIYDSADDEDLGNVQEHGSVIMHLLSQVSIGMDLTKITLPTFILERRSLLEMYADFFAIPELFVGIAELGSPEERLLGVVHWYLASFYAGRRSQVAKKPYNPILGETFKCRFAWPGLEKAGKVADGPVEGADANELTFFAEQVSHHPPISAFYAECPGAGIQVDAHIWTKSKFLGLSIGVHNIGQGAISLLKLGETYTVAFPNGYGRSIMTTPWIELAGKVKVACSNGFSANVEFHAKPFYGGKAHCVTAELAKPDGVPFARVKGQWNGQLTLTRLLPKEPEALLVDVHKLDIRRKLVAPVARQADLESRRLWRHVTAGLATSDIARATEAKRWLEARQRGQAKLRQAGLTQPWAVQHFADVQGNWLYKRPLAKRLKDTQTSAVG